MDSRACRLQALLCCLWLTFQSSVGDPIHVNPIPGDILTLKSFTLIDPELTICATDILFGGSQTYVSSSLSIESNDGTDVIADILGEIDDESHNTCAVFTLTADQSVWLEGSAKYEMIVIAEGPIGGLRYSRTGNVAFTAETYSAVMITCGSGPINLYRVAGTGAAASTTDCIVDPTPDPQLQDVCYTQADPSGTPFCYTPSDSDVQDFEMCTNIVIDANSPVEDSTFAVVLKYPDPPIDPLTAKLSVKFASQPNLVEAVVQKTVVGEQNAVEIYLCSKGLDGNDCSIPDFAYGSAKYQVCAVALDDASSPPTFQDSDTLQDLNAFAYEQPDQFVVGFVNGNPGGDNGEKKYVVTDAHDSSSTVITVDCTGIPDVDNCYGFFTGNTDKTPRTVTVQYKDDTNTIVFPYLPQ